MEPRAEHDGLRIRRDPRELVTLLLSAPTHEIAQLLVNARRLGQVGVDACLLALAYYLAYVLRFDSGIPHRYEDLLWDTIPLTVAMKLVDLRDVRALLEALALRRPEGLRVDPEGGVRLDRRR